MRFLDRLLSAAAQPLYRQHGQIVSRRFSDEGERPFDFVQPWAVRRLLDIHEAVECLCRDPRYFATLYLGAPPTKELAARYALLRTLARCKTDTKE
jgi:hypothetical protein